MEFKNWKLVELRPKIINIYSDELNFKENLFCEMSISQRKIFEDFDRGETEINWNNFSNYYCFSFDNVVIAERLEMLFKKSDIGLTRTLLIFYNQEKIAIELESKIFFKEWEDIFQSTKYNTIIINKNLNLVIEVTRDYMLHSNFGIYP